MARQDEAGRTERPGKVQQLRSAVPLTRRLPIAPDVLTKWYRQWRAEHTEFEKIVFHGLRHSSATYQLLHLAATSNRCRATQVMQLLPS